MRACNKPTAIIIAPARKSVAGSFITRLFLHLRFINAAAVNGIKPATRDANAPNSPTLLSLAKRSENDALPLSPSHQSPSVDSINEKYDIAIHFAISLRRDIF